MQLSPKQNFIEIPRWFDRHLHIRDGDMMALVLPCTLRQRATGAGIMCNLKEPVSTIERARAYLERIQKLIPEGCDFKPRLLYYLTDHSTPEEVVAGFREGLWCGVKLYMANQQGQGGTTGSAHGVKDLRGRYPVFSAMEKYQISLAGHFEAVEEDVDEFDREVVSMQRDLMPLNQSFPGLPITVEHITDLRMADYVAYGPNTLRATVTAHHLRMNRNWLFWGGMNPINYCKPIAKREKHRLGIRKYVTSGNRRFGAGTDSAPHDEEMKALPCGCAAGIVTATDAVEHYTDIFDQDNALEHLGAFMSENFIERYGMTVSTEMMRIERRPHIIQKKIGKVHVFMGGKELPWTLVA